MVTCVAAEALDSGGTTESREETEGGKEDEYVFILFSRDPWFLLTPLE
jgi:hypothetical protein